MASTPDHDVGWGLRLVFQDGLSPGELSALKQRLNERSVAVGLGRPTFLDPDDEWPSCVGEPDCLTVDETVSGD